MAQMIRRQNLFPKYLDKQIQEYADKHTFGNFSGAVRRLTKERLEALEAKNK